MPWYRRRRSPDGEDYRTAREKARVSILARDSAQSSINEAGEAVRFMASAVPPDA